MKSGTWFGSTPYRCRTSSGPIRAISRLGTGVEDRSARRGELKGISIAARHQGRAACMLLGGHCGREKVIRFVSGRFGVHKPKCGDKFRQDIQLVDQIIIELSPTLISGKHLMTFRRRPQSIPADDDCAGLFVCVEAQQEICKAEDSARALAVAAANVFRQCWYERCAKESPSITSSGRSECAGLSALAPRLLRPVPSAVR
jgi:hypothetical protein